MNANLEACEPAARYLATQKPPLLQHFDLVAQAPGGVARLREQILTIAAQGKLVPQDSADEPASVLLERIREKKARLVKDGRIRKDKPLAAISDEEKPFKLPENWQWVRLGLVVDVIRGITFPASEKSKAPAAGKIACLRTANVQDQIEWDDLLFVDRGYMSRDEQLVQPSDIVMSMANSRELVGKAAIITRMPVAESTIGGFLSILRPNLGLPQFLMIVLRTQYARSHLVDSASQTTNIANISLGKLNPLPIPIPPLAEQARIVARVEELMALCDALEEKRRLEATQHERLAGALFDALANSASAEEAAENWQRIAAHFDLLLDRPATVDRLEQTILQLAIRGRLVPQNPADEPASALLQKIRAEKDRLIASGQLKREKPLPLISNDEKPFELPEGWEWSRFRDVAEIASNLVSPHEHQHMPQVAPDCIEKATGRLTESRTVHQAGVTSPNHLFRPGQILYSKIRPSLSKAVIVDFEGLCSADMYPINSFINTSFLHRFLLSQSFLAQVQVAENRVKMPKLNQEALNSFVVPVPPLAEQSRIVTRLSELRAICAQLRDRLTTSAKTQSRLAEALLEQAVA